MLEEHGTVVGINGSLLEVETNPRSGCSSCGSGSCTTSVVAKLFNARRNLLELENSLGANVGDRVVIGISDQLGQHASHGAIVVDVNESSDRLVNADHSLLAVDGKHALDHAGEDGLALIAFFGGRADTVVEFSGHLIHGLGKGDDFLAPLDRETVG